MSNGHDPRIEPLSSDEQRVADHLSQWHIGQPTPDLDHKVLAHAREAVTMVRPTSARRRPSRSWLFGAASAATFVFAVGLIWRVTQAPPERLDGMAPSPPASLEFAPLGDADVGIDGKTAREPADTTAATGAASDVSGGARRRSAATPARPSPQLQPNQQSSMQPNPDLEQSQGEGEAVVPTAPHSPPSFPAPAEPFPAAPPPPPAMAPPSAPVQSQPKTLPERGIRAELPSAQEHSVLGEAAAPAENAPPSATAGDAAQQGRHPAGRTADAASAASPPERAERAIERIRRLIARGERERALRAIERLKQRYPDRELPDDLQRFIAPGSLNN